GEVRPVEVRMNKRRAADPGVFEVRANKARAVQCRTVQPCVDKVREGKVRVAEVCLAEAPVIKICISEPRPSKVPLPRRVPAQQFLRGLGWLGAILGHGPASVARVAPSAPLGERALRYARSATGTTQNGSPWSQCTTRTWAPTTRTSTAS